MMGREILNDGQTIFQLQREPVCGNLGGRKSNSVLNNSFSNWERRPLAKCKQFQRASLLKFIRHDCRSSNSSSSGKRWTEEQAPRVTNEGIKLHRDARVATAARSDCGGNKRNIFMITVTFLTQRLSNSL